ncbi:MAG: type 4a pilus biogenesis protein PilO [Candidatus Omnitrophica bacterium]|nr:type 4a pilus biogenesis protein PilO [Candidatus Omnitrophota bacterium]
MDKKLTGEDKNNILTMFILTGITVLFLQFIYFPKVMEVKKLSRENKKTRSDIAELYNFIGGQENLKDNIIKARNYAAILENALPSEKEASNIIKQLNEEARDLKVSVISVKPRDLSSCTDTQGLQLNISDHICKSMPINLSVEARYQALGDFLHKIEFDRNPMMRVNKVEMRKDINILPKIKADIELSAGVLGE